MSNWGSGFGSPSLPGGIAPPDLGFGQPTPASWDAIDGNVGFGSPSGSIATAIGAILVQPTGQKLPDDGGQIVALLSAHWPIVGDYKIRLLDSTGQAWPSDRNCWSARMGGGDACMTDGTRELLTFCAPPVPPGTYSLRLWYGAGVELIIPGALVVVNRSRNEAVYRMRRRLPPNYATGPRTIRSETEIAW